MNTSQEEASSKDDFFLSNLQETETEEVNDMKLELSSTSISQSLNEGDKVRKMDQVQSKAVQERKRLLPRLSPNAPKLLPKGDEQIRRTQEATATKARLKSIEIVEVKSLPTEDDIKVEFIEE